MDIFSRVFYSAQRSCPVHGITGNQKCTSIFCDLLRIFHGWFHQNVVIRFCEVNEDAAAVPNDRAAATQFLFVRTTDDKLLGMIQVRHYFTDYLETFGGHIGYSVRPDERRKGYAKKMLKAALPFCKSIGIEKVLVTCIDGNIGSEKAILANGGVYETAVYEPNAKVWIKRFWITPDSAQPSC